MIAAALALVIFIILMLPVNIHIESESPLYFRILCFKFGKKSNPDSTVAKEFQYILGISEYRNINAIKKTISENSASDTVAKLAGTLKTLFGQVVYLFSKCTFSKLHLNIIIASEDAAKTATEYGKTCACLYALLGYVRSVAAVKRNSEKIDVRCDFTEQKSEISYDVVVYVRVFRVVRALFAIVKENIKKEIYK